MRLIIRTDASESSDFGTGHVQRMTLFAENIKNYGNIFFLMRSKNQFSVSKTIQTKFKVVKINSDRDLEQNTKEELFSILNKQMVFDGDKVQFDSYFEKECKGCKF